MSVSTTRPVYRVCRLPCTCGLGRRALVRFLFLSVDRWNNDRKVGIRGGDSLTDHGLILVRGKRTLRRLCRGKFENDGCRSGAVSFTKIYGAVCDGQNSSLSEFHKANDRRGPTSVETFGVRDVVVDDK